MAFEAKTREQIRADILRVIYNGAVQRGFTNVNINVGSDFYLVADGLAQELETLYADESTLLDRVMPDTATGDDLDRWLAAVGLKRRSPGPSTGNLIFDATEASLVATDQELLDPSGAKFKVLVGNTYSPGDPIPVYSDATGIITNLDGGATLRWVSPPAFAANTADLDANGATGGVDQEDDETAQDRLLTRLREPPGAGNSADISGWGEEVVSAQRVFVYPACNGPGTVHTASMAYAASSTSRNRVLNASNLAAVTSSITVKLPEHVEHVSTTVTPVTANVTFALRIPNAQTADPAGTGGGWVDGAPFPRPYTALTRCVVGTVTSTTNFQITDLAALPIVGQKISYIDNSDFKLYTAEILTVPSTSGSGPYAAFVTLDTPFPNVATGDYIFPAAENTQTYLDAVLGSFARLGPGEKTNQSGLLPRAYRRPRHFEEADYRIGTQFLRDLVDSAEEVQDSAWLYQNGGTTTPALPASIANAPNIFAPNLIAFYPEQD